MLRRKECGLGLAAWLVEENKHANMGSPFGWKCLKKLHAETSPELILYRHHFISIVGKTIALTIWTFVSKVMSLLFNTLSRFVKTLHHDLILTQSTL